ncbi:MAG TPA: histone-like nucleoid-structuring protein Lsr2, partial [Pedococcus sp.]|nr:histone-like nucleoid-structuring protein Lsr2 [Pedococcus sp.]
GGKRDLADVRDWARKHGHTVSDRGRISAEIQAAYDKAH